MEEGVHLIGAVEIGEGTIIRSGSYIKGPVKIGEGCDIGPRAVIHPSTSIGDNTMIRAHTSIRNSIIMEDVVIGDGSIVDDSVLGCGVHLGAGCMLPSDRSTVLVDGECHEIQNVGAMIGEDTRIGPLVAFTPGVVVGWGCRIGPQSKVIKNLENRTVML